MSDFLDAVRRGDRESVTRLVDQDPSLLSASENGVSAILLALYHGQRELAALLVERGAPLSFADAAAVGDVEQVQAMLRAEPGLLDRRSADGFAPLGLAIFFGNRPVARLLIAEGADVHAVARNAQRVAPIHAAAAVCDHEILTMLLDHGADPDARQQSDYTPLHTAAARGDIEMARLLLARGADPAVVGSDGFTVGDVAAKYGQTAFAAWWGTRRP